MAETKERKSLEEERERLKEQMRIAFLSNDNILLEKLKNASQILEKKLRGKHEN